MKYTLTLEFESKEELLAHLSGAGQDVSAHVEEAPKASKKKAPKEKDVLEDVKLPEQPAPKASIFPETPAAPAFDRDMAIADISSTINELTQSGTPGQSIAELCSKIFGKMNHAITKISLLENDSLEIFHELFKVEVKSLKPKAASPAPASFI